MPPVLQRLNHRPGHAVGADDHPGSRSGLLRIVDHLNPQTVEPLHHMAVMDDGSQRHHLAAFLGGLLHQLHSPGHPEAEAGVLGYLNAHKPIFSFTTALMASSTPSISSVEVSTFTASLACFSGAMARWES